MNDNDLERRLRTESGPREGGYVPSQLPSTIDPPPSRGASRTLRAAVLVGAVAAGALAVAAVSALIDGGSPDGGVGSGTTATPSASASPFEPADCQPLDLQLAAEPWTGAAGSRGTVVAITLADGRYPCILQQHVGAEIADAEGTVLTSAVIPMIYAPVQLDPAAEFTVGVSWSNWCDAEVAEPVSLAIVSGGVYFPVEVPDGADPVPPCLGENMPTTLNVTELQTTD